MEKPIVHFIHSNMHSNLLKRYLNAFKLIIHRNQFIFDSYRQFQSTTIPNAKATTPLSTMVPVHPSVCSRRNEPSAFVHNLLIKIIFKKFFSHVHRHQSHFPCPCPCSQLLPIQDRKGAMLRPSTLLLYLLPMPLSLFLFLTLPLAVPWSSICSS